MKAVYVKEDSILKYFIFGIDEKKDEIDSEEYQFENIEIIKSKAFQNLWNVKKVLFDEKLKIIEKEAFKDCSELEVFCCGQVSNLQKKEIVNLKINELVTGTKMEKSSGQPENKEIENNQENSESNKDMEIKKENFIIQTSAFSGCKNLHTVVFPKCSKLTIEKSAFANCSSLRTVVAFVEDISFTENPFEDCLKELTFVCSKDSEIERFARENGYGIIYA